MGYIVFMMACNNPDNGVHQGWADHFTFEVGWEPTLELEGQRIAVRLEGDQLRVSRRKFHIQNYGEWVGNWCWDAAKMDVATALDLIAYLQSMKKFQCISGFSDIFDAWKVGEPITREMFEMSL